MSGKIKKYLMSRMPAAGAEPREWRCGGWEDRALRGGVSTLTWDWFAAYVGW
jgi:hypothetical protein